MKFLLSACGVAANEGATNPPSGANGVLPLTEPEETELTLLISLEAGEWRELPEV